MNRVNMLGRSGALVASALLIVACGGSTPHRSASAAPGAGTPTSSSASKGGAHAGDACALVNKTEIAAALGFPITTVSGGGMTCIFQGSDPSKIFNLDTYASASAMAPMLQLEPGSPHVDGLGSDAFWSQAGILFARHGDHALAFHAPDLAALRMPPDALVQLAKTALARLG